jgi:hypothetical protein
LPTRLNTIQEWNGRPIREVFEEFPKWESVKNKSGKSGVFFEREIGASTHHVSPRFYHVLTIKKPRSVHLFLQKPPVKHLDTPPNFFPRANPI